MHSEISEWEFKRYIYPSFPDAPRLPRKFTIDELVCTFLALHDVEVAPIGADIHMSRSESAMMGAAFGLTSPVAWDTMATGAQMKQDARIAARHEWNSWKQWALSHADWPSFKEKANADYDAAKSVAETWRSLPSNQDLFKSLVEQGAARESQEAMRNQKLLSLALGLPVVVILSIATVNYYSRRDTSIYSPDPVQPQVERRY